MLWFSENNNVHLNRVPQHRVTKVVVWTCMHVAAAWTSRNGHSQKSCDIKERRLELSRCACEQLQFTSISDSTHNDWPDYLWGASAEDRRGVADPRRESTLTLLGRLKSANRQRQEIQDIVQGLARRGKLRSPKFSVFWGRLADHPRRIGRTTQAILSRAHSTPANECEHPPSATIYLELKANYHA